MARIDRHSMTDLHRIAANVEAARQEIAAACLRSGRDAAAVNLVAVTKTQGPEVLPALREAGIRDFGENRVEHLQEMVIHALPGDRWHYIGRVQARQLAKIAPLAQTMHSLCDLDHVERLARACIQASRRLGVYIQVNASGESAKAGVTAAGLPAVLVAVRAQPALELLGLMTMAPDLHEHADPVTVRACFAQTRQLAQTHALGGLSMGMSGDLAIAVEEGATVVRLGSRLFS